MCTGAGLVVVEGCASVDCAGEAESEVSDLGPVDTVDAGVSCVGCVWE